MTNDEGRVRQVISAYQEFGSVVAPVEPSPASIAEREDPSVLIGEILSPKPSHAALALQMLTVIEERRPQVIGNVIEGSARRAPKP